MSRLGANIAVVLVALLLLGAGAWLVAKRGLEAEIAAARTVTPPELARLRSENLELNQRSGGSVDGWSVEAGVERSRSADSEGEQAPSLRRPRLVSELISSGLLGRFVWPSPRYNSLDAGINDVAFMLDLSPPERAKLHETATAGKTQFAAALLAAATVQHAGAMVTIDVPPVPKARAAYEQMEVAFKAVLGPERYTYYESLGAKDALAQLFELWGLDGIRIMIAHATSIPEAFYAQRLDLEGFPIEQPLRRRTFTPMVEPGYFYAQVNPRRTDQPVRFIDDPEYLEAELGPLRSLIPPDL